jgi:hypothetical protein
MEVLDHEQMRCAICESAQPLDDAAESLVQERARIEFWGGIFGGRCDSDEGAEEGHESRWI